MKTVFSSFSLPVVSLHLLVVSLLVANVQLPPTPLKRRTLHLTLRTTLPLEGLVPAGDSSPPGEGETSQHLWCPVQRARWSLWALPAVPTLTFEKYPSTIQATPSWDPAPGSPSSAPHPQQPPPLNGDHLNPLPSKVRSLLHLCRSAASQTCFKKI